MPSPQFAPNLLPSLLIYLTLTPFPLVTAGVLYRPPIFQGMEYKTETVGLQRTERVYTAETSREVAVPCQENVSRLDGGPTTRTVLSLYDRDVNGAYLPSNQRALNLSHVYELNYADSLPITLSGSTFACPSIPANYARLTRTSFVTDGSYVNTPVHLPSLPSERIVFTKPSASPAVQESATRYWYDSQPGSTSCSSISPALTSVSVDNHNASAPAARGNLRCTERYKDSPAPAEWLSSGNTFDIAGNVLSAVDARGKVTTLAYNAPTNGLPTGITNPLQGVTTVSYDTSLRRPTVVTDENQQTTSYSYLTAAGTDDPLDRLGQVDSPAIGRQFEYNDSLLTVTHKVRGGASTWQTRTIARYDAFGRVIQEETYSSTGGAILVNRSYDALGRLYSVSNPNSSDLTTTVYDSLDRLVSVTAPGGAVTANAYAGADTTTTDPAGRVTIRREDSMGRLISVKQFRNAAGPSGLEETTYQYNGLDLLTQVSQGAQTRTFNFDSIGRLRSASNVEKSGADSWSYDPAGNITTHTDPRSVVRTSTYDDLNRPLSTTFSTVAGVAVTPAFTYTYDLPAGCGFSKGRLCKSSHGVGSSEVSQAFTYDAAGRVSSSRQRIDNVDYNFSYAYTATGQLSSTVYPSGRVVSSTFDPSDRILSTTTAGVSAVVNSYAPHGAPAQVTLGNGVVETWGYNARLQPVAIRASGPGAFMDLGYEYGTPTANNGNVSRHLIKAGLLTLDQTFTYDGVNRLASAAEQRGGVGSGSWLISYDYDRWGNMYVPSTSGISVPLGSPTATADYLAGSNQRVNGNYDAAGNLLNQPNVPTMTYDAAGRMVTAQGAGGPPFTYLYDVEGRRVKQTRAGAPTVFVYDAFGRLAAEYGAGSGEACSGCYLSQDSLGSTRLVTERSGVVRQRLDFLPFGAPLTASSGDNGRSLIFDGLTASTYTTAGATTRQYTGKERDAETGLDYFGARYMSAAMGRFTSPDEPLFDQFAGDPQSWNLYSYVRNNPLAFIDPNGRQADAASPCKTTNDPGCIASVDSVLTLDKKIKGVTRAAANTAIGGVNLLLWVGYGFGNATSNGAYSNSAPLQIPYLRQDPAYQRLEDNVSLAMAPLAVPKLLQALRLLGRGGILTRGGHALQKHGGRPGSAFPPPAGNEHQLNQMAEQIASEILGDPGKATRQYAHPRYGNVLEVTDSKGRGMIFTVDQSQFIGFREP